MAGRSPPITPRMRRLCLEPSPRTHCSADSGYGSLETSPTRLPSKTRTNRTSLSLSTKLQSVSLSSYDGNSSEESTSDQSVHEDSDPELIDSPSLVREKFATLPRVSRRRMSRTESFPMLPHRKSIHRRHGSDNTSLNGSRASSLRALDRFVPQRDHATPGSERLRTTKPLDDLTPSERLVRHNQDAPDPFFFRRKALPPSPTEARKQRESSHSRTTLDTANHTDRRLPSNSIWSVGGMIPSQGAVEDGRGGLFASGTTAPMFNTKFPPAKPKAQEDVEKHEARLASAFEIDWSSRILGFDRSSLPTEKQSGKTANEPRRKTYWKGTQLVREEDPSKRSSKPSPELRTLPVAPFKVLDAPNLRDDYYCSILAFDSVSQTLAVGLGTRLYSWAESTGVQALEDNGLGEMSWLTTLDFSSAQGKKCILAYGRSNGILNLMSLWDAPRLYDRQYPRFRFAPHVEEAPVACVSWKPTVTVRPSVNPYNPGPLVDNEDLLVGDEQGNVFYYAIEWPLAWETYRHNWRGSVQCLACITSHSQQICGLSWAPSGNLFATGGNDNLCFLFETERVTKPRHEADHDEAVNRLFSAFREPLPPPDSDVKPSMRNLNWINHIPNRMPSPPPPTNAAAASHRQVSSSTTGSSAPPSAMGFIDDRLSSVPTSPFARFFHPESTSRIWDLNRMVVERPEPRYPPALPGNVNTASESFRYPISATSGEPFIVDDRHAKHRWEHTAAVKAIAFCPWREGLLATGGGSHDKCIHFYHTTSGVALATIAVHAQVTSLIWSTTRREIAATFGYAQPDHPYRIAVFSWPECRQVAAIPWEGEHRALYAIPYPQGPPDYRAARNATGRARDLERERREKDKRRNRTAAEGCIVVAASDKSIKFHEVWSGGKKATVGGSGLLGGSDILEDLEGIDKEGDIIR